MKIVALIPAYNEESRVGEVVSKAQPYVDEIVVVDDGSLDRTSDVGRKAGALVLKLPVNLGYGAALHTGYLFAYKNNFGALVQLDADGQHNADDIPALLSPIKEGKADVVIGSRFLSNSNWQGSWIRRGGMRFFSLLIRVLSGKVITDPTSGFQAMNKCVIRRLALGAYPDDFPDADVLIMLLREKFRIMEVGVSMAPPPPGKRMHSGLKPFYYVAKMLLSVLVVMLRVREETINDS